MKNEQIEIENDTDEAVTVTLDDKSGKAEIEQEPQTEVVVEDKPKTPNNDAEEYSKSVQKRINKMTKKLREAERERDEAAAFAKSALSKANEANATAWQHHQFALESERNNLTAELARANNTGDVAKATEIQVKLSENAQKLSAAKKAVEEGATRTARLKEAAAAQPQVQPQVQPQAQPQAQPQPSAKAQAWAAEREWFGTDKLMTMVAMQHHQAILDDGEFDADSDEYYDELNRRIAADQARLGKGTDAGADSQSRPAAPLVADTARTGADVAAASGRQVKGRRTVHLTKAQAAMARRLNVPLEEYAKYVPKKDQ